MTDAVHANGSFIYLQLGALGRAADPAEIKRENVSNEYTAASTIPLTGRENVVPRAMTGEEIQEFVSLYATAASNAVHKAGFDGVEIHGANGYLVDQFLQDVSNNRTDNYGGSLENRSRFALEAIKAVVGAVGEKKTGLRLSPWSKFQGQSFRVVSDIMICLTVQRPFRYGDGKPGASVHPPPQHHPRSLPRLCLSAHGGASRGWRY